MTVCIRGKHRPIPGGTVLVGKGTRTEPLQDFITSFSSSFRRISRPIGLASIRHGYWLRLRCSSQTRSRWAGSTRWKPDSSRCLLVCHASWGALDSRSDWRARTSTGPRMPLPPQSKTCVQSTVVPKSLCSSNSRPVRISYQPRRLESRSALWTTRPPAAARALLAEVLSSVGLRWP